MDSYIVPEGAASGSWHALGAFSHNPQAGQGGPLLLTVPCSGALSFDTAHTGMDHFDLGLQGSNGMPSPSMLRETVNNMDGEYEYRKTSSIHSTQMDHDATASGRASPTQGRHSHPVESSFDQPAAMDDLTASARKPSKRSRNSSPQRAFSGAASVGAPPAIRRERTERGKRNSAGSAGGAAKRSTSKTAESTKEAASRKQSHKEVEQQRRLSLSIVFSELAKVLAEDTEDLVTEKMPKSALLHHGIRQIRRGRRLREEYLQTIASLREENEWLKRQIDTLQGYGVLPSGSSGMKIASSNSGTRPGSAQLRARTPTHAHEGSATQSPTALSTAPTLLAEPMESFEHGRSAGFSNSQPTSLEAMTASPGPSAPRRPFKFAPQRACSPTATLFNKGSTSIPLLGGQWQHNASALHFQGSLLPLPDASVPGAPSGSSIGAGPSSSSLASAMYSSSACYCGAGGPGSLDYHPSPVGGSPHHATGQLPDTVGPPSSSSSASPQNSDYASTDASTSKALVMQLVSTVLNSLPADDSKRVIRSLVAGSRQASPE